jgi:hypothetical protein
LVNGAGGVDRLGGNGGGECGDGDGLLDDRRLQGDGHFAHGTDGDIYVGGSLGKSRGADDDVVGARGKFIDAKFAAIAGGSFALEGGVNGVGDFYGGDAAAGGVLDDAAERAAGILRGGKERGKKGSR